MLAAARRARESEKVFIVCDKKMETCKSRKLKSDGAKNGVSTEEDERERQMMGLDGLLGEIERKEREGGRGDKSRFKMEAGKSQQVQIQNQGPQLPLFAAPTTRFVHFGFCRQSTSLE